MDGLVYLKNDEPVCSSLQVAEKFGKRHADVMRSIDNLIKNDSTQNCVQCFKQSAYKDDTGKSNKMYMMNKDGFAFLVMGFTGKKWTFGLRGKTAYNPRVSPWRSTGQYLLLLHNVSQKRLVWCVQGYATGKV